MYDDLEMTLDEHHILKQQLKCEWVDIRQAISRIESRWLDRKYNNGDCSEISDKNDLRIMSTQLKKISNIIDEFIKNSFKKN